MDVENDFSNSNKGNCCLKEITSGRKIKNIMIYLSFCSIVLPVRLLFLRLATVHVVCNPPGGF